MSRFRDLWVSGKFAIDRKNKDVVDERAEKEAAQMLHNLIPEDNQRLFNDLQKRRGSETGRWLKDLAGDAPQTSEAWVQAQAAATEPFDNARVWMDALFQEFAGLTYNFNENAVGTDLFTSLERAQIVETRDDDVWYHPVTRTYQGRLTTRYWCLYVRGNDQKVSVYIFPAEMTIGFKAGHYSDEEAPPFLVAEQANANGKHVFKIQGEEAPLALIPHLAKELFGDLIRVASNQMAESELFSSHNAAPKLGENVAVGYDQNAQPAPSLKASEPHAALKNINLEDLNVFDACDLVDKVLDKELKRLYQEASKVTPGSPQADVARKQISSVETFRMRIVDAFENFTKESHALLANEAVPAGKK